MTSQGKYRLLDLKSHISNSSDSSTVIDVHEGKIYSQDYPFGARYKEVFDNIKNYEDKEEPKFCNGIVVCMVLISFTACFAFIAMYFMDRFMMEKLDDLHVKNITNATNTTNYTYF